ncbi:benzoate 4-monooxygenase cytochrome-like protein P450 [Elsinoe ampelina]|uniref:Benzoate 4-monooxygenase cytochrome-like protein P450 n=1 Tax=Elsinoe ampelina TaxID=302913 RepID=A0A6A6G8A1_9PEZI|nr:benzoate 4-monooxygenase cytochrome-like protein P450 [Elsinoe ampelina]
MLTTVVVGVAAFMFARLLLSWPISIAVLASILAWRIGTRTQQYLRLGHIPGPPTTGWLEIWHSWVILRNQSHIKYAEACERYGHLARIGPNDLITDCPELLIHMNSPRSGYTKTEWFYKSTRLEPGKDTCFSQTDPVLHQKRRAQLAAGYSGKDNPLLESKIDEHVTDLVALLRRFAASGGKVDMGRVCQYYSLDVITDIGFGASFDDLKDGTDNFGYLKTLEQTLAQVASSSATGLSRLLQYDWFASRVLPTGDESEGMGRIVQIARRTIQERFRTVKEDSGDMVSSFKRKGLTEEEIVTESLLTFVAGSDTVSSSLRAILLFLAQHDQVYERLRAEIASFVVGASVISDADAQRLLWLNAVIKESLRLHPPITDIVPKTAPAQGDTVEIDGTSYFIPGGTNVGYSAWSLHRRKDIFGEDSGNFKPERWLAEGNDEAQLVRRNKVFDLMFGSGRHQCLGKQIGLMELRKAVVEITRCFRLSVCNTRRPWNETNYLGLWVASDFWMKVSLLDGVA